jgi:hypothetical protein
MRRTRHRVNAALPNCGDPARSAAAGHFAQHSLSPSSRAIDASLKLAGYFRLPGVAHYLIVDPDTPLIIHHARQGDDSIVTRIVCDGVITIDPTGLELALADVYGTASRAP